MKLCDSIVNISKIDSFSKQLTHYSDLTHVENVVPKLPSNT